MAKIEVKMEKYLIITYRGNDHWDVSNKHKRLCKIRGEAGNFCIHWEDGIIKSRKSFRTISEAMGYIAKKYMEDPENFNKRG